MKKVIINTTIILTLFLASCATRMPVDGLTNDQIRAELIQAADDDNAIANKRKKRLPPSVSAAMTPSMNIHLPTVKRRSSRRFDIAVKEVPAKTFFMGLVKETPYSMTVSPDIQGTITLNLKRVTIEQALQTVENVYGYQYRRTRVGFEILANKLQTKIYQVNYIDVDRKGNSTMSVTSGQVTQGTGTRPGSSSGAFATTTGIAGFGQARQTSSIGEVVTKSDFSFWKKLETTLKSMLGTEEGHSVSVNPLAGVVVVRAFPSEQKQISAYLDAIQNNMDRQVILEAKVLEVQLNDQYQMGIDWKILGAQLNAINDFPGTNINLRDFPDAFTINIKWKPGDFESTIRALETQGNVQVLSSPRVATLNNQKAVIKVGSDEFFVTNVSSSNTETFSGTTPTQDVELTPFFSGITLDVTPQIDGRENVTLHVHPAVSRVQDQRKIIDLGQGGVLELPLAFSTVRESDTVVHAKNGQVVIIGGLMESQSVEDVAQLPFFGNIPFLGTLLRNTKQQGRKSELVILIKPVVIKRRVWAKEINDTNDRFTAIKKGFHFGGRPDLFGTDAEQPIKWGPKTGEFYQQQQQQQQTIPTK
jgi:MSHA biogenesis protein MshL